MGTQAVRISDLTWPEYAARTADQSVVMLPVGALEQHGLHLPLSTDALIAERLAEQLAARINGLILPTLTYGARSLARSGGGEQFPGTVNLDGPTLIALTRDIIREQARHGVTRFVALLGRLRDGLQDVPVSRGGDSSWGIKMPGDEGHSIYVWIDALFNYLSVMDTRERRAYWPADVHLIAKDILWFHAVIWPCLLMAMGEELPKCVYAHSFWIREGRKMSKSLGNFIDMQTIDAYCARFGTDALRWYLLTQGPLGATDADFSYGKFVEVYNADLANGIGNAASRVVNMISKYFDGKCPIQASDKGADARPLPGRARDAAFRVGACMNENDIDGALRAALGLSNAVDQFINDTTPFKLAKDAANMGRVGAILYDCVESIRIAAVLLSCALPEKMGVLLGMLGQPTPRGDGAFGVSWSELTRWGVLEPGTPITKGEGLFPRADGAEPEPGMPG